MVDGWWTLDNMLLVHAIGNSDTKGLYKKSSQLPLPSSVELACSIVSPRTHTAYTSEGFVLQPTLPTKLSYTDVGSYVLDIDASDRLYASTMWTPDKFSMEQLVFMTLAGSFYNEVFVHTDSTSIVGVFSDTETVDAFVERKVHCVKTNDSDNPYAVLARIFCNAMLEADFYVEKKRTSAHFLHWAVSDKLQPGLETHGYVSEVGYMHRLACDLILGEVDVATLLGDLPREEVYGGAFVRQPLTAAHKDAIKDVLRL